MAKRKQRKIELDPLRFGPRLREMREGLGLSQKGLSQASGLSQRGISNWENLDRVPSWEVVLSLCAALGVLPEAFLEEPAGEQETRGRGRPRKGDA